MIWREDLENIEEKNLCDYASKSRLAQRPNISQWRHNLNESDTRLSYQLDRDRIIYSKTFKRLEYKTQVFIYRYKDHFRTRLTHTLEVTYLSRALARVLKLNEDLVEAIGLAHDIGHTPFGHAGEEALDKLTIKNGKKGFCHNENGVRILAFDENWGKDWEEPGFIMRGINPTIETLEGVLKHTSRRRDKEKYSFLNPDLPGTLESQVVAFADEIVQQQTDLYDALYDKIISEDEINKLKKSLFDTKNVHLYSIYQKDMYAYFSNLKKDGKLEKIINKEVVIKLRSDMQDKFQKIKDFHKNRILDSEKVQTMDYRAKRIVKCLFNAYLDEFKMIKENWRKEKERGLDEIDIVTYYIAGMTDKYALRQYDRIFGLEHDS